MDKIGDSPPVPQSVVSTGKLMARKSWSAGSVASSGNTTSTGVGVLNDADVFSIQTPLFSSSFKANMMESIGRASAGKPGFAGVTGFAGSGTPHSSQPHTRVAVVGDSTGTVVGAGIGVTGLEFRAGLKSDGLGIAVSTGEASPDSRTGPKMRAPVYVSGFGPGPALDGPIEPGVGSSTLDTNHEAMHAMGLSREPGERITSETMQVDCHQRIIQLNEVEVVPNLGHGSKQEGDHSRQNPFSDNEVLDRNPWVIDPIAEPRVVDPVCVDPQIARTKGKGIMEDGFIKVTKKKKKNNSPKPRVQIPSLHVSKPGPSKPMGRARPNVITRVTVSNPFEALDDVNQIDDGFPELNATLKKFAMRYVKEKTIPDPDVFKTWCTDLKEYYYSLIKDDGEEVESETDGTAKMMSTKGSGGGAIRRQKNRPRWSEGTQNRYTHLLSDLRVAEFLQETTAIEATVLPLSMRGPSPAPPNATKLPRAGSDGRSESMNQPAFGAQNVASCNLPSELEVVYPTTTINHSRVTKLLVTYQWKPPHYSHCAVFGHSLQQCKLKPPAANGVVTAATPGNPLQNVQNSVNDIPIAPMGIKIANAPKFDDDGFTMVSKHNKRGPIKLQSKNQKPVRVKLHSQQQGTGRARSNLAPNGSGKKQQGWAPLAKQQGTNVEVINEPRVPPIAPKNVNSGFNYSRAVHGGKGSPRQQRDWTHQVANSIANCTPTSTPACLGNGVGSSKPSIDSGFDSANRFSVLDIPSSIKFNKLMVGQEDLYPPDSGLADSMDVEMNALNSKENVEFMSNRKYGITDAQKQVIVNCIRDFKYVQAEAVEEWTQGEWDFFADKCMELGLDQENSILYPEEDTEIVDDEDMDGFESAHAVSQLKKLGSYSDPVVTKSPNRK
ncbi:hypothetical protein L1987_47759 [Smallanthus sonchifolius]|uniref:Uncharacterized protein n=1 Tax=Smallanthus sonchifolius TaxID=185202 RepID=A0ACB9FQ40_9ASTR|nr:hypothetical protein L1987_47759 [Smallanthus sonchifolius]